MLLDAINYRILIL